jgi:hypothetical protein
MLEYSTVTSTCLLHSLDTYEIDTLSIARISTADNKTCVYFLFFNPTYVLCRDILYVGQFDLVKTCILLDWTGHSVVVRAVQKQSKFPYSIAPTPLNSFSLRTPEPIPGKPQNLSPISLRLIVMRFSTWICIINNDTWGKRRYSHFLISQMVYTRRGYWITTRSLLHRGGEDHRHDVTMSSNTLLSCLLDMIFSS